MRGWEKTETDERVELLLEKLVVKIVITKRKIAKPRIATIFLFENFILSERLKHNEYKRVFTTSYFWRTFDKKEIDLVEELNGQLNAYEIKYGSNKKYKVPNDFINNYLDSTFKVVDRENYLEFEL